MANEFSSLSDWDDDQWDNFIKWLKQVLHNEVIRVSFTKVDGTEREMNCTLKSDTLTEGMRAQAQESTKVTPGTRFRNKPSSKKNVTVWDVDANGWRTITVPRITNAYEIMLKYDYNSKNTYFDYWG